MNFISDRFRRNILIAYSVILVTGISYLVFVRLTGIRIPCTYYELFGLLCPGCGITRMFVCLSCLDFATAFMYNPACFVFLFFWLGMSFMMFVGKPSFVRNSRLLYTLVYITVATLAVFGIVRNFIPFLKYPAFN